jgi:hypothetical protein
VLNLALLAQEVQFAFTSGNIGESYSRQTERIKSEIEKIRTAFELHPEAAPSEEIANLSAWVDQMLTEKLLEAVSALKVNFTPLSKAKSSEQLVEGLVSNTLLPLEICWRQ